MEKFRNKLPGIKYKIRVFDDNNHFYKCSLCKGLSGIFRYSKGETLEDNVDLVCEECNDLDMVSIDFKWLKVKK